MFKQKEAGVILYLVTCNFWANWVKLQNNNLERQVTNERNDYWAADKKYGILVRIK